MIWPHPEIIIPEIVCHICSPCMAHMCPISWHNKSCSWLGINTWRSINKHAASWYGSEHVLRADSRFAPSQWETALLCNNISHWLSASLESVLCTQLAILPTPRRQWRGKPKWSFQKRFLEQKHPNFKRISMKYCSLINHSEFIVAFHYHFVKFIHYQPWTSVPLCNSHMRVCWRHKLYITADSMVHHRFLVPSEYHMFLVPGSFWVPSEYHIFFIPCTQKKMSNFRHRFSQWSKFCQFSTSVNMTFPFYCEYCITPQEPLLPT